jgi:hypothetical protein
MKVANLVTPLFILSLSVILYGCPPFTDAGKREMESVTSALESDPSAMPGSRAGGLASAEYCSMANDPNLQSALKINSTLSAAVKGSTAACEASANALSHNSISQNIRRLRDLDHTEDDLHSQLNDLNMEIDILEGKNSGGIYTSEIMSLKSQRDMMRSSIRTNTWRVDTEKWRVREQAIDSVPEIMGAYEAVLNNCNKTNPKVISSMAHSGLALASSLSGFAGTSVYAASLLTKIASNLVNTLPSFEDKITDSLNQARVPYVLICGIEAVTKGYCQTVKEFKKNEIRSVASAEISCASAGYESINDFSKFSSLLPGLKGIYDQKGRRGSPTTWEPPSQDGQTPGFGDFTGFQGDDGTIGSQSPSGFGKSLTQAQILAKEEQLSEKMGEIENYLNAVKADAAVSEGESDSMKTQKGRLQSQAAEVEQVLAQVKAKMAQTTNLGELGALFTDPKLDLAAHLESIFTTHGRLLKQRLLFNESSGQTSKSNVDYNLSLLSKASIQSINASVPASKAATVSATTRENGLSHAVLIGAQNINSFSKFVNEKAPLDGVISVIEQQMQDVNGADQTRALASKKVIKQLCGASLSLFKEEQFPSALIDKCRDYSPIPGTSYEELAKRHWDDRSCVSVETGVIGQ